MLQPLNKKITLSILRQKTVRVGLVLSGILLLASLILLGITFSYDQKIAENNKQITDIQAQLASLQQAASQTIETITDSRTIDRALAPYDEIVPFISFLESLFAIIDKDSKITIKNEENEILINRYADYEVKLKPGPRFDLFLRALDGLHKSKYLTKITNFEVNYTPVEENQTSVINDVTLVVRLYFE